MPLTSPKTRPFQSTLPARGATLPAGEIRHQRAISIHAPREGSDCIILHERRPEPRFQSTLPARGATILPVAARGETGNFNPRSPRGERHFTASRRKSKSEFQSTLPARGATFRLCLCRDGISISIHAPREGSDDCFPKSVHPRAYFNPRSPRGERLSWHKPAEIRKFHFNPRSPRGERHRNTRFCKFTSKFQSTLPARGATKRCSATRHRRCRFQSTLPARGATYYIKKG